MVSDIGISKAVMIFVRFELFPLLVKLLLECTLSEVGGLVFVAKLGSSPVLKTMLAIGFHMGMLKISWAA